MVALSSTAALAGGFAVRDLGALATDAKAALGSGYEHRAEPRRLTLICTSCQGAPMIDVLLGRQNDGTEERVRSGQTTIGQLEAQCRARNPDCRLSALDVAPAVGWISSYPLGGMVGSTAVILRDGDLLTIRSLASDPDVARGNAETLVRRVAPKIIGR